MTAGLNTKTHDLLRAVLGRLRVVSGPDAKGEHICWCPFHADGQGKPPHQPNLHVSERGFFCHACGAKGGLRKLAERLGVEVEAGDSRPAAIYDYQDEKGELLFQVCRMAPVPGGRKPFRFRRPDGAGGWMWNLKGVRRVLYRVPRLVADQTGTVYVVEGEKDADRLAREGLLATTNPGGAGKWCKEYTDALRGRDVVILPDNDGAGRRHGETVAGSLLGVARSVKVVDLPGLGEKGDVSDWLDAGHDAQELQRLVEQAPVWDRPVPDEEPGSSENGGGGKQDSQAKQLVSLALARRVQLFHDERGEPYAAVPLAEGRRILSLDSRDFSRWLSRLAWAEMQRALGGEALAAARQVLGAMARFDGEQHRLHVRCAWHDDAIWVDLDGQRAARADKSGWQVVPEPPILFRSFPHQRPLPEPVRGGDPSDVLAFVNLRGGDAHILLLAYLVAGLVPNIPMPALVVHGVQGSAKTTLLKVVKSLLDPSAVEVRGGVRDLTEFAQAAWQNRVLFFDNLASVPGWLSDALCRAVTGEGWSKRTLYTNEDSTVFEYQSLVGLSGINLVASQSDLLDRSLILSLDPVTPSLRRDERSFWRDYDDMRPRIFGGMLDALSRAMGIEPRLHLPSLPRMADFARWGAAVAEALGHSAEGFLTSYERNVGRQNDAAVDASPVAQAILAFVDGRPVWEGTPAELLEKLEGVAVGLRIDTRERKWPKAPSWLSRRLREVQPNLTAMGLEIELDDRSAERRTIAIRKAPGNAVIAVTGVRAGLEADDNGDGTMTASTTPDGTGLPTGGAVGWPDANDGNDGIFAPTPAA